MISGLSLNLEKQQYDFRLQGDFFKGQRVGKEIRLKAHQLMESAYCRVLDWLTSRILLQHTAGH